MKGICLICIASDLFLIPYGTLPWQPILGKIGKLTFIQHSGIPKWILVLQFHFTDINWQYFCYILCKFEQDRSSRPIDTVTTAKTAPFWTRRQKLAYPTEYCGPDVVDLFSYFRGRFFPNTFT